MQCPTVTMEPSRYRAETTALLVDLHAALPPDLQVQLECLLDRVEEDAVERAVAVEDATWARIIAHLPGLELVLQALREHAEWCPNGRRCCAHVSGADAPASHECSPGAVSSAHCCPLPSCRSVAMRVSRCSAHRTRTSGVPTCFRRIWF